MGACTTHLSPVCTHVSFTAVTFLFLLLLHHLTTTNFISEFLTFKSGRGLENFTGQKLKDELYLHAVDIAASTYVNRNLASCSNNFYSAKLSFKTFKFMACMFSETTRTLLNRNGSVDLLCVKITAGSVNCQSLGAFIKQLGKVTTTARYVCQ